jgi:anti-sigma factor RsiW
VKQLETMTAPAEQDSQHLMEWDPRLWDWVDGVLEPMKKAALEQHLEYCGCCQQRLVALQVLDRRLNEVLPSLCLDAHFDEKLLSQLPPL